MYCGGFLALVVTNTNEYPEQVRLIFFEVNCLTKHLLLVQGKSERNNY